MRVARPSDAEQLRLVHLASYEWGYRDFLPPRLLEDRLAQHREVDWADRVSAESARGGSVLAAVDASGEIHGLCQFGPCDDPTQDAELSRLFVLPQSARLGIGGALMGDARRRLLVAGWSRACLWVLEADTVRARPFYEAMGWRPDGGVWVFDEDFGPDWHGRLNRLRYCSELGETAS